MKKHSKLIFYSSSIIVLGFLTIWQIVQTRAAQIGSDQKNPAVAVDQIKTIVGQWNKREAFEFDADGFMSSEEDKTDDIRSAPTKTATTSGEEK